MKKVVVETRPHVVIRGEVSIPDDLTDDNIADYLSEHIKDVEFDWTPVYCSFAFTDLNVIEIDGRDTDIWQSMGDVGEWSGGC